MTNLRNVFNTIYVVKDEHTLGYFQNTDTIPTKIAFMGVLHGSVLKGGHDWKNGPVAFQPGYNKIRLATAADFDEYRVKLPPDWKEPE